MMICLVAKTVRRLFREFNSFKQFLLCCASLSVFLSSFPLIDAKKQYCRTEYSPIKNSNETVEWVDDNQLEYPIIFSNPICLDEKNFDITRLCIDGEWIPKEPPVCNTISTNVHCPHNFNEYDRFCIIEYDEKTKKKIIPHEDIILNSENSRKITICDSVKVQLVKNKSETELKNCSRCSEMQCGISNYIILPYDHRFQLCPENCLSPDLISDKCYCKVIDTEENNNELAEVENILQKRTVSRLVGNDICEIKDDKILYPKLRNFRKVFTNDSIGYTKNSTNCSIIETKMLKLNKLPSMMLTFDYTKKKLSLLVENSDGISPSNHFSVRCYTNAGFDPLKNAHTRKISVNPLYHFSVYDVRLEEFIGEYWCEAFSLNLTKIKSNTILAWRERLGHEYSLRLSLNVSSFIDHSIKLVDLYSLRRNLTSDIMKVTRTIVRLMKIINLDLDGAEMIVHLTTRESDEVLTEFERIKNSFAQLPGYIKVSNYRAVEVCFPEETNGGKLHWDKAEIWERKMPREMCLQSNGVPVFRTCIGNFISGAHWSQLAEKKCEENMEIPPMAHYLNEKLHGNLSTEVVDVLTSLSQNASLSYLDIYLFSQLIRKIEADMQDVKPDMYENIFNIMNSLSKENKSELSSSQTMFNTTDTLLLLLDNQLSNIKLNDSYRIIGDKILTVTVYPFASNISGIYLLGDEEAPLNQLNLSYIRTNETLNDINEDYLDSLNLAANIPQDVLGSIEQNNEDPSDVQVVFTIFYEDSFFIDSKKKSASKVMSITISGYEGYLNSSIPLVLKSRSEGHCGYWNLGQKFQRRKGEWSSFGGTYYGNFMNRSDLHICEFSHLTHFALLIVSESIKVDEGNNEITEVTLEDGSTSFYLTVITIIGGGLSGIGIFGIYLTAILFGQWRKKDGTKILLNLSTAILLEIVFLQFSGVNGIGYEDTCKLIGCLLHYTLLSKFCWMFIYALLQYRRFVKVLGVQPKKLILKSMFFGWGFAVLPVLLTLSISSDSYSKTNICYLHGLPLYIAVIFPVSIIILANLVVFIVVMYHVSTKKVESTVETKFSVLQLYLAILLFSVLGIPWLFAIFAEFVSDKILKKILMYLFCLTGTLQGFILFVFYVLINEETRKKWRKYLNNKCQRIRD